MIKVFIIDDSMMVRNAILKMLKGVEGIKVIGEAPNPVDAFDVFKKVGLPDVFILDIEMPKMDGLTFLKQIKKQKPIPVIICSTLVSEGSTEAIDALRLGAVDIVLKPKMNVREYFEEEKENFVRSIKAAAISTVNYTPSATKEEVCQEDVQEGSPSKKIIAIGSSTGGVQVLEEIMTHIKPNHPGIVITQHMPEGFTNNFATRLNKLTKSYIVEAKDGDIVTDNKVIIAKGGNHMEVVKDELKGHYKVKVRNFPKVNQHKPSVNVLFSSIAKVQDVDVTAFILTGMGDDGATGLKKLRDMGAKTFAQNKQTCVVYGMPNVANQIGAVEKELSIFGIIQEINKTH
jgi:two-component system chemotaxis response regulator CheB